MKHKLESRFPRDISITSNMQMTPLMTESEEELKSLLMKVNEESEKADLKLYIQKATVRTGHGTMDWFQIGKRVHQGCELSPCLFILYAEYIMK